MRRVGVAFSALFVLGGCAHGPSPMERTVRAAVAVRDCPPAGAPGAVATVVSTAEALRIDMGCGRRPFRILYRVGEDHYTHHEVGTGETHVFSTAQVKELTELQRTLSEAPKAAGEVPDRRQAMAKLLAQATDSLSRLRIAKFRPSSIGETTNGIQCRRYDVCIGDEPMGEACLARADRFDIEAGHFAAFADARKKFQGLLGTSFDLFDPYRQVEGTGFIVVRLAFGDDRRGVLVPRLRSLTTKDVSEDTWDVARLARPVVLQ
jgi:hypothetical protein